MHGVKSKVGPLCICCVVVRLVLVYDEIGWQLAQRAPPPFSFLVQEGYWVWQGAWSGGSDVIFSPKFNIFLYELIIFSLRFFFVLSKSISSDQMPKSQAKQIAPNSPQHLRPSQTEKFWNKNVILWWIPNRSLGILYPKNIGNLINFISKDYQVCF